MAVEASGWDIAAVCAKTIGYAATLGAAGTLFLLAYGASILSAAHRQRFRRWILMMSITATAAGGVKVLLLAGSMSGELAGMFDASLNRIILRAGEGISLTMRLAGLLLANAALLRPRRYVLAVFGALLAVASFAATGHVHALPAPAGWTVILTVHLVCAAFWLGALAPLYWVAGEADDARCAALAARFGRIAVGMIALLVAAGAAVLAQLLDSFSDLWRSDYGRLVAAKILLVGCLLGCAAFNKLHLTPALLRHDPRAASTLRRSIAIEMALALGVLLLTAAFTSLLGPHS